MNSNIKNIIFDLGGVIIELDNLNSLKRFQKLGLNWDNQALDLYHQKGVMKELEQGKITAEQFAEKLSIEAGKHISPSEVFEAMIGFVKDMPLYKLDLLLELRERGYKLFLLSNTNPVLMKWARGNEFTEYGKPIDYYFDKMYLSYEIGSTKPEKEIFQFMISASKIIPSESLFIDDSADNIAIGKEFGLITYLAKNGEDFRHLFI
jgi:putative hydrolase of the HAD superfamily